mmetsp:Transcript_7007/g.26150  ORF Transcript_7007/g.26150 Transcript_7007/m.26150 type:complete len:86 (+) Transcript_7007:1447-1704(+)
MHCKVEEIYLLLVCPLQALQLHTVTGIRLSCSHPEQILYIILHPAQHMRQIFLGNQHHRHSCRPHNRENDYRTWHPPMITPRGVL